MSNTNCNYIGDCIYCFAEHRLRVIVAQFDDEGSLVVSLYNHLIPSETVNKHMWFCVPLAHGITQESVVFGRTAIKM